VAEIHKDTNRQLLYGSDELFNGIKKVKRVKNDEMRIDIFFFRKNK